MILFHCSPNLQLTYSLNLSKPLHRIVQASHHGIRTLVFNSITQLLLVELEVEHTSNGHKPVKRPKQCWSKIRVYGVEIFDSDHARTVLSSNKYVSLHHARVR